MRQEVPEPSVPASCLCSHLSHYMLREACRLADIQAEQLNPVGDAVATKQRATMILDGVLTEVELDRHFLIGAGQQQSAQDSLLSSGEVWHRRVARTGHISGQG